MKTVPAHKAVAGKEILYRDPVTLTDGKNFVRAVTHAVHHDGFVRGRQILPQIVLKLRQAHSFKNLFALL